MRKRIGNNSGFTLLEVILAITIASIMTGAFLQVIMAGFASSQRYSNWLTTETQLSRSMREICYGYGSHAGVAGAISVEVLHPTELHITYNDHGDKIVYSLQDSSLVRHFIIDNENKGYHVLLSDVTALSFTHETQVGGEAIRVHITVNSPSLKRKQLDAEQTVLMRNS